MKKIILNVIGFLAGVVCFYIGFLVVYWVLTFISRFKLLGAILYWPSDVGIAMRVMPLTTGIFAAIAASCAICGNAKIVGAVLIALNALSLVWLLANSALGLVSLIELGIGLGGGFLAWNGNK